MAAMINRISHGEIRTWDLSDRSKVGTRYVTTKPLQSALVAVIKVGMMVQRV